MDERIQNLLEVQEDEETLRQRYRERADTVTDLKTLYDHATEEWEQITRRHRGDSLEDWSRADCETLLKWEQRRNVLRQMLRNKHNELPPRLPSRDYEYRLRATIRAFELGKNVTDVFEDAAEAPYVNVTGNQIRKRMKAGALERHGFDGQLTASKLGPLLREEKAYWDLDLPEVEKVENDAPH